MNLDKREHDRAELDAAMRDYLARGKKIEVLPTGAMKHNAGNPINFGQIGTAHTRMEAERKAAKASEAAPPVVPTPKRMGKVGALPGTKTRELLDLLKNGALTAHEIATIKGWTVSCTRARIDSLVGQRRIECSGVLRRAGQRPRFGYRLVGA
jgi:hypothetical protein